MMSKSQMPEITVRMASLRHKLRQPHDADCLDEEGMFDVLADPSTATTEWRMMRWVIDDDRAISPGRENYAGKRITARHCGGCLDGKQLRTDDYCLQHGKMLHCG